MKERHWCDRIVGRRLRMLARRERNRKLNIARRTARGAVELA